MQTIKNYNITTRSLRQLKEEIKLIIRNYSKLKNFKIYIDDVYLKIKYKNKLFYFTILEKNSEFFWYLKPYYNDYLLIKEPYNKSFDLILTIIKFLTKD